MTGRTRSIGPVATALRIIVALGLVYLAGGASGFSWDVEWYDLLGGLIVLPGLTLLLGLAARRYGGKPVRFTGPAGHAVNCLVIVALVANPYTGGSATLFYAAMLLIAAWRGQAGCEVTVLPNWILGRDDQVGCPVFAPIDHAMSRGLGPRSAAEARQIGRFNHDQHAG
jgi:hypothetical protein